MNASEQLLVEQELIGSRRRLEKWVQGMLSDPVPEGQGRNNQMIQLAPRMLELGFDNDGIFESFKSMYDLEGDDSKDGEIWAVVRNAQKYVRSIEPIDPAEVKRQKQVAADKQRAAAAALKKVMTSYRWTEAEIIEAGGLKGMDPTEQRSMFLPTMFEPSDTLWLGQVHMSGKPKHAANFKYMTEWAWKFMAPAYEFIAHCTFQPGSTSRCVDAVDKQKYLVVESDTLGRDEVGAVFNWLAAGGLKLRAVVYSGGKSLHGWFDWPDNAAELAPTLTGLQCDPSVMRVSQPVRCPGILRKDSGRIQTLLYLAQ